MNERIFVEKNKILEYPCGSHLYGTNTPTSDEDFAGVFIAPIEFYLGLKKIDEVDFSVVSKLENGKNSSNAVDRKFYEFRKFVKLASECNPNIIETLWCPLDKFIFSNEFGMELIKNKSLFLHKGLYDKFIGYSKSQLHKMRIKPDNYNALQQFKECYDLGYYSYDSLIVEYKDKNSKHITYSKDFCTIGDLNFNLTRKMKDVYKSVVERISKSGNRTELFTKYGYDTKFGMHCVRLLFEGIELLETGNLEFPLKQKDLLLEIRNGNVAQDELMKIVEDLQIECTKAFENSKLPEKCNFDKIEKFLIDNVKRFHKI